MVIIDAVIAACVHVFLRNWGDGGFAASLNVWRSGQRLLGKSSRFTFASAVIINSAPWQSAEALAPLFGFLWLGCHRWDLYFSVCVFIDAAIASVFLLFLLHAGSV